MLKEFIQAMVGLFKSESTPGNMEGQNNMKFRLLSDRVLYKYYRITSDNLNSLSEGKIWLSHPSKFNDPFDAKLRVLGEEDLEILDKISEFLIDGDEDLKQYFESDLLKVHLGEWIDNNPNEVIPPPFSVAFDFAVQHTKKDVSELIKFLQVKMPDALALKSFMATYAGIGISSFATEPNDPKMWAHYADNHKGFCVKFNLWNDKFPKDDSYFCSSVEYKDGPHGFHESSGALGLNEILSQLSLKSRDWVNEKEVRIISLSKPNRLAEIPGLEIEGICFGLNTPSSDKEIIKKVMSRSHPDIKFYQAKLDEKYLKISWENKSEDFGDDILYRPISE